MHASKYQGCLQLENEPWFSASKDARCSCPQTNYSNTICTSCSEATGVALRQTKITPCFDHPSSHRSHDVSHCRLQCVHQIRGGIPVQIRRSLGFNDQPLLQIANTVNDSWGVGEHVHRTSCIIVKSKGMSISSFVLSARYIDANGSSCHVM